MLYKIHLDAYFFSASFSSLFFLFFVRFFFRFVGVLQCLWLFHHCSCVLHTYAHSLCVNVNNTHPKQMHRAQHIASFITQHAFQIPFVFIFAYFQISDTSLWQSSMPRSHCGWCDFVTKWNACALRLCRSLFLPLSMLNTVNQSVNMFIICLVLAALFHTHWVCCYWRIISYCFDSYR